MSQHLGIREDESRSEEATAAQSAFLAVARLYADKLKSHEVDTALMRRFLALRQADREATEALMPPPRAA